LEGVEYVPALAPLAELPHPLAEPHSAFPLLAEAEGDGLFPMRQLGAGEVAVLFIETAVLLPPRLLAGFDEVDGFVVAGDARRTTIGRVGGWGLEKSVLGVRFAGPISIHLFPD
jgi:hypothetical protein